MRRRGSAARRSKPRDTRLPAGPPHPPTPGASRAPMPREGRSRRGGGGWSSRAGGSSGSARRRAGPRSRPLPWGPCLRHGRAPRRGRITASVRVGIASAATIAGAVHRPLAGIGRGTTLPAGRASAAAMSWTALGPTRSAPAALGRKASTPRARTVAPRSTASDNPTGRTVPARHRCRRQRSAADRPGAREPDGPIAAARSHPPADDLVRSPSTHRPATKPATASERYPHARTPAPGGTPSRLTLASSSETARRDRHPSSRRRRT